MAAHSPSGRPRSSVSPATAYGILTINFGACLRLHIGGAPGLAVCIAALFAAVLGYFLFFGRITGVFLGIVTLSVTLVLERFMAQTAGPEWRVGAARLNGFNGMSGMPPLTLPWFGGDIVLYPDILLYYLVLALVVLVYLGLRMLVNAPFGNVLVAIRENPERAEMLGLRRPQVPARGLRHRCDPRRPIGRPLHLMGAVYHPLEHGHDRGGAAHRLGGGRGTSDLTATLIGTLIVLSGFQALTIYGSQYALVVMGLLLVVTVLVAPEGIVAGLARLASRATARARGKSA